MAIKLSKCVLHFAEILTPLSLLKRESVSRGYRAWSGLHQNEACAHHDINKGGMQVNASKQGFRELRGLLVAAGRETCALYILISQPQEKNAQKGRWVPIILIDFKPLQPMCMGRKVSEESDYKHLDTITFKKPCCSTTVARYYGVASAQTQYCN